MTSVSTVVWKKAPSRVPPCTSVAPCSTARSTCSSRPSAALSDESGPSAVLGRGRVARLDLGELRRELLEERVVELVDDDEPLGRVAGLAAVVEARVDRGLHGGVEVVGREQDEGVGAAELEHDLLEVTAGDLGDGGAGALGAGERDALHARVGDDRLDLLVRGVDVHVGALGEAGVEEDLLDRGGRLGALLGVLQQDRVADDEVRAGEAGDLVVREVPRHDAEQHAERRAADEGRALAGEQLRSARPSGSRPRGRRSTRRSRRRSRPRRGPARSACPSRAR